MTAAFIEHLTNTEAQFNAIQVIVLHPAMNVGSYMGNHIIEWGYPDQYPNSQVVGLAHEVLHCLTDDVARQSGSQGKWVLHALIYLAANEALRCQLNSQSVFFEAEIIRDFDARLIAIARDLEPCWRRCVQEDGVQAGLIFRIYENIFKSKAAPKGAARN